MLYVSMMPSQVPWNWRTLAAISIECGIILLFVIIVLCDAEHPADPLPRDLPRAATAGALLGQVNSDCMAYFRAWLVMKTTPV